jgi:hypothetical protein
LQARHGGGLTCLLRFAPHLLLVSKIMSQQPLCSEQSERQFRRVFESPMTTILTVRGAADQPNLQV